MTVNELIDILSEFDGDAEVVIGMQQRCGSDFMKQIVSVTKEKVDTWYDRGCTAIVITEGAQMGTVHYGEYDEDDDYDDEDDEDDDDDEE